jgi:ATP-dependent Lon protease
VKEQLNKLKSDDEFEQIDLSFIDSTGNKRVIDCQESKNAIATLKPVRINRLSPSNDANLGIENIKNKPNSSQETTAKKSDGLTENQDLILVKSDNESTQSSSKLPLAERHYRIHYDAIGYSYQTILGDYLHGADEIIVEDAYIRHQHQILNFLRFCELAIRLAKPKKIKLITKYDDEAEKSEALSKLATIGESLKAHDVEFKIEIKENLHDRHIFLSNGWTVKIGRGFDIYQRPDDWLHIGASDMDLRPCLETSVDIFRTK